MSQSQSAPVSEVIRSAYLERQDGAVEVERAGASEVIYFREGELHLDRDHPAARHLSPLLQQEHARPASVPEIQRAMTTLSHDLLRERGAARFKDKIGAGVELVGPLPTVLIVMETATHGLNESDLLERLGGEPQQYQAADNSPALQQLPGLEPEMAQVLTALVQPASVQEMLRSSPANRLALLRGMAKLRAVGLIAEVGGRSKPEEGGEILPPRLLQHFMDRIAESLESDPLVLDVDEHRNRLAEMMSGWGNITHYEMLDVGHRATQDDVLSAYNRLARVVHPVHAVRLGYEGRDEALGLLFEQATEAYLVLSDPRRRSSYNMIVGIQLTTEVDAVKRGEEKKKLARQNFVRAGRCMAEMDYSLAVDLLKEAARLDPKAEYFARLGLVLAKNHNWHRQAVEAYRRAIELAPNDAGIHMGFGEVLESMDRLDEAKQHYKEALKLMPGHVAAEKALLRIG